MEHNKKLQLTADSAVRFRRLFYIKVQTVAEVHRTPASVN
jgi:hypothetical protein